MKRRLSQLVVLAIGLLVVGCSELGVSLSKSTPWTKEVDSNLVYALGSRESFKSPLSQQLKPACPALRFKARDFTISKNYDEVLTKLAAEWAESKGQFLVAGYAPPSLPEDYARSLSERRAQAVRQRLIELGIEAADIQTVGFGSDFGPSGPSQDVVVIYREGARSEASDAEEAEGEISLDPDLITVSR